MGFLMGSSCLLRIYHYFHLRVFLSFTTRIVDKSLYSARWIITSYSRYRDAQRYAWLGRISCFVRNKSGLTRATLRISRPPLRTRWPALAVTQNQAQIVRGGALSPAAKPYIFQRSDVSSVFSTHVLPRGLRNGVTRERKMAPREHSRGRAEGDGWRGDGIDIHIMGEFAGRLERKSFRCPADQVSQDSRDVGWAAVTCGDVASR